MDQNKLECQSISYDLDEMELETISFNSDDDGQIENYEDIDNFDDNIQFLISKIGSNQTEFIITLIATKMFIPSYYIPGEISLVKFSLKEGITEELSRFFYPQDIPSDLKEEATKYSEQNHQLPLDDSLARQNENIKKAEELYDFIHIYQFRLSKRAILFCVDSEYVQVCMTLEWCKKILPKVEWNVRFIKLSQLYYFYSMEVKNGFTLEHCLKEAESDRFVYYGLCDYHFKLDNKDCARTNVVNSSFLLAQTFCASFSIEMIADKHMPSE